MDLDRRETPLLMGLGIIVAIVALLFFGMTTALQQVAQRKARWQELREHLAQAERRAQQRSGLPPPDRLAAEARAAAQLFVAPDGVPAVRERLEALARGAGVTVAFLPSLAPEPPAECLPGFEACYQVIPMVAMVEGRYREIAAYLKQATALTMPAVALRSVTMTPLETGVGGPRLKTQVVFDAFLWTPAARPAGVIPSPALAAAPVVSPAEGWRRDPFDPRWFGTPQAEGITLGGILWDPQRPTCVLNGTVLEVGQGIHGYTVVAITPHLVVLRGARELVLAP